MISPYVTVFTSHYVSINSKTASDAAASATAFTSHYVSINSNNPALITVLELYLHPTMYLLIHASPSASVVVFEIYIPLCIY